jgi:hypothetical protein
VIHTQRIEVTGLRSYAYWQRMEKVASRPLVDGGCPPPARAHLPTSSSEFFSIFAVMPDDERSCAFDQDEDFPWDCDLNGAGEAEVFDLLDDGLTDDEGE